MWKCRELHDVRKQGSIFLVGELQSFCSSREVCVLLCVAVSHQKQLLCLLCIKDGSPASTCSSSPKLDWMIKRGMVGLSQTVSSFVPAHLSVPFVSCLFLFFLLLFSVYSVCVIAVPFWYHLGCFCWSFQLIVGCFACSEVG